MAGSLSYDPIRIANEEVSIYFVCDKAGIEYSSMYGSRAKLYCPFGSITHIDGGATRAFRIYEDSNSCYCFACTKYYDPVGLYCELTDMPRRAGAEALLIEYGWKPETFDERWDRVSTPDEYDNSNLPEALNRYCARIHPDWVIAQFQEPFSSAFTRCSRLSKQVQDESEAMKWLDITKTYMKGVIDAAGQ